jgi:hypothetical protein
MRGGAARLSDGLRNPLQFRWLPRVALAAAPNILYGGLFGICDHGVSPDGRK